MEELLKKYKIYLKLKKLSLASQKNYFSDVKKFLTWLQEKTGASKTNLADQITPETFDQYKAHLTQNRIPSNTVNRQFASLRLLGEFLKKENLLMVNPAFKLENMPHEEIVKENPLLETQRRISQLYHENKKTLIIVITILIVLLLALGLGIFFYVRSSRKKSREEEAYLQKIEEGIPLPGGKQEDTGEKGEQGKEGEQYYVDPETGERIQIDTEGMCEYCLNARALQGHTPSASASAGKVPVITNTGDLVLGDDSPMLYSTLGTFGIGGQALSLFTAAGTDGDITLAPDGNGALNVHLNGESGNHFQITNANISSGALINAYAGNSIPGFDLLRLSSGTNEVDRFIIGTEGDMFLSRNATISGNLQASSALIKGWLTDLFKVETSSGSALFKVKNSGLVEIAQYLSHLGDVDTYLNFEDDSLKMDIGTAKFVHLSEGTTDTFHGNYNKEDIDFRWDSDTSNYLIYADASTDRVGIGTNTPNYKLDVIGGAYISGDLRTGGHIFPANDDTQDLGSTSYEWRNLYLDGTAYVDSAIIDALTLAGDVDMDENLILNIGSTGTDFTTGGGLTLAGALTSNGALDANAQFDLGDGGDTGAIDTSNWDVSTAGLITTADDIAVNGGDITTTDTTFNLLAGATSTLSIGPTGATAVSITMAGGSGDTGCTIAGDTGNLTCTGNITGSSGGIIGYWSRSDPTLTPATANDVVAITSSTAVPLTLTNTQASGNSLLVEDEASDTNPFVIDGFGNVGIGTTTAAAKLQINTGSATNVGLIVRAAASQSSDLAQWQNSSSTNLIRITSSGTLDMRQNPIMWVDSNTQITQTSPVRLIYTGNVNATYTTGHRFQTTSNASAATQYLTQMQATKTVANANDLYGLDVYARLNSASDTQTAIYGTFSRAMNINTATLTNAYGLVGRVDNTSTGTINTAQAVRVETAVNSGGGTIDNNYGIFVQDQTVGTTDYALVTNAGNIVFNEGGDASTDFRLEGDTDAYLIYTDADVNAVGMGYSDLSSAVGKLLVNGNVGIGTTTPAANLDIAGDTILGATAADTITFTGVVSSDFVAVDNTRDIGSASTHWQTGYFDTVNATSLVGTVVTGSTSSYDWLIGAGYTGNNAQVMTLSFERGDPDLNAVLKWNASGDAGRVSGYDDNYLFNFPVSVYSQVSGGTQTFTSGSIFNFGQNATHAITQTGAFVGLDMDLSSNITVPNSASGNQTGVLLTMKDGGASATTIGLDIDGTADTGIDLSGATIGTNFTGTLVTDNTSLYSDYRTLGTGGVTISGVGEDQFVYGDYNDITVDSDADVVNTAYPYGIGQYNNFTLSGNYSTGIGFWNDATITDTTNFVGLYNGGDYYAGVPISSSQSSTNLYGIYSELSLTGSQSFASGTYTDIAVSGELSDAYGHYTYVATDNTDGFSQDIYGGFFNTYTDEAGDNSYAVYAYADGSGTNYGIYSIGGNNYFGGNVGIGSSSPTAKFDVRGGINAGTNGTEFTVSTAGLITTASNLAVNGGDITTTDTTANLFAGATSSIGIGPTGATAVSITMAGGSGDTGCTVAGDTGNLTCTGNITGSSSGTVGFWSRSSTTLSPATANDIVSISSSTGVPLTLTNTAAGNSLLVNDEAADTTPFVVDQFGNVGIGTSSPGSLLELASSAPTLRLTDTTGAAQSLLITVDGNLVQFEDIGGTSPDLFVLDLNNARVGIGTTTPTATLEVNGTGAFTAAGDVEIGYNLNFSNDTASYIRSLSPLYIEAGDPNSAEDLVLRSRGTGDVVVGSGTTYFKNNGNVGIGTVEPGNKLGVTISVNDAIPSLGSNGGSFGLFKTDGGVPGNYGFIMGVLVNGNVFQQAQRIDGTATAYDLLLQPSGGNVGIGTASPTQKLDVAGTIVATGSRPITISPSGYITIKAATGGWADYLHFLGSSGTDRGGFGAYGTSDTLTYLYAGDSYSSPTMVWQNGNVGIGTTTPGQKLQVNGNLVIGAAGFIDDDTTTNDNSDDWLRLNGYIEMKSNTNSYGIVLRDSATSSYFGITQVGGASYLSDSNTYSNYFIMGDGTNATVQGDLSVYGGDINGGVSGYIDIDEEVRGGFTFSNTFGLYPDFACKGSGGTTLCEFTTGIYNNGSTFYSQNQIYARGGVANDTAGADLSLNDNVNITGNLGIGVTAATKLHVEGELRWDGTEDEELRFVKTVQASNYIEAYSGAEASLVAIGYSISTRASKRNFQPLSELIDSSKIYDLEPLAFNYKSDKEGAMKSIGLVAEDVEKVIPNLVAYDSEGKPHHPYYELLSVLIVDQLQKERNERLEDYKYVYETGNALPGESLLKVITTNGSIIANDPITSSDFQGVGMKAVNAGWIVGKALQSTEYWNEQNCPVVSSVETINWPENDGTNQVKPCFRLPDGTYVGKIMVSVNPSWYDPDVYLTDSGDFKIVGEDMTLENSDANKIVRVGAFSEAIIAKLKAGLTQTTNLISDTVLATKAGFDIVKTGTLEALTAEINDLSVDNLKATTKLTSPLVETDNLIAKVVETDLIKPLSDQDLILQIENSKTGNQTESTRFKIVDENQNELFAVDSRGNATISGKLTAKSATISGELVADAGRFKKLYAEEIEGLDDKLKTAYVGASQSASIVNNYYYESASASASDSSTSELSLGLSEDEEASLSALAASISNQQSAINNFDYLDVSSLDTDSAVFNEFLAVLGQAVITNLNITNILTLDNNMAITKNSIGTVGCSPVSTADGFNTASESALTQACDQLYLQPSGLGGINMLAGKFIITESGNVAISGNLTVAGNVNSQSLTVNKEATVSGSLFAKLLKPLEGDLTIQLNQQSGNASEAGKLRIKDANNKLVASIDASGSAVFRKLNIAVSNEATISSETVDQVNTNATAGKAILPALEKQIIIPNQNITKGSLIYITPASDTANKVLYIKNKKDGIDGYFTVALDKAVVFDIEFNWWIIN